MPEKIIPVICGPTASGKSAVALELAIQFPVEIVSADSAQVVKYLDIGTAKPTAREQSVATHHCIDLVEPGVRYSAFRFVHDADMAIESIIAREKLPIVVGGTGLYIRALMHGIVETDKQDPSIRKQLETEAVERGPDQLYLKLKAIDPESAAEIHPSNIVRIIRALEINLTCGMTKKEWIETGVHRKSKFRYVARVLQPPREMLYSSINTRVDRYMSQGFLKEVTALKSRGLAAAVRSSAVIGYSELLDYLDGCATLEQSLNTIKMNTRRYAKRQTTWFKAQPDMDFFVDKLALKQVLTEDLARLGRAIEARN